MGHVDARGNPAGVPGERWRLLREQPVKPSPHRLRNAGPGSMARLPAIVTQGGTMADFVVNDLVVRLAAGEGQEP